LGGGIANFGGNVMGTLRLVNSTLSNNASASAGGGIYNDSLTVAHLNNVTITNNTAAAGLFGSVNQLLTYFTTPVIGEAGLLAAAILLLRVLPHGITGKWFRGSL
jgi:branched-chain amino acid transport system permease protein